MPEASAPADGLRDVHRRHRDEGARRLRDQQVAPSARVSVDPRAIRLIWPSVIDVWEFLLARRFMFVH